MHALVALLLPLTALPSPAPQDLKARAELFVRPAEGEGASPREVRAAIRVHIEPGWHLYHDDLGPPDAVGMPTTLRFESGEWSKPRFPAPLRLDQPGVGEDGGDTWIWGHEDELVIHVAGRLAEGETVGDLEVRMKGLTCEDEGTCIPWSATLESAGAGPDAVFAAFPADLAPPGGWAHAAAAEPGPPGGEPGRPAVARGPPGIPGVPSLSKPAPPASQDRARARLFVEESGEATGGGKKVRAAIEIRIDAGWHLYHDDLGPEDAVGLPTTVTLSPGTWEKVVFPKPRRYEQPGVGADGADTWILGHEGRIVLHASGELPAGTDPAEVRAQIRGQTCDPGLCIDWRTTVASEGAGSPELFAGFGAGAAGAPHTDGAGGPAQEGSLWGFLALAVFWGVFALLMPCTYPMIPITISYFTKQAAQRGGSTRGLSLMYGLGIVGIFILIGVVVGPPIVKFASHPLTNLFIGVLFLVFALVLFGVIHMQPPQMLMSAAGKASRKGGYAGVFLMGATLVITSFTCTAPFVGSLLAVGASKGELGRVVLGMGTFGLTMAIPFVILSMIPARIASMPRSGEWMNVLKVFLGFVEVAAALKFLSNADIAWKWELLTREIFLLLWLGIFLAAALYLFGIVRLRGESEREIGPLRMVGAMCVLLFSLYCGYGVLGHRLGDVMAAIAPPIEYGKEELEIAAASPSLAPGIGVRAASPRAHVIVKDDYDAARSRAREEGKLLLVNFTGFL
jgi:DsbC/DsbD-like thiol-disulfide interchange protein/cytochrome c biogenesis protein CcdA